MRLLNGNFQQICKNADTSNWKKENAYHSALSLDSGNGCELKLTTGEVVEDTEFPLFDKLDQSMM
jgi:hypothetical protein